MRRTPAAAAIPIENPYGGCKTPAAAAIHIENPYCGCKTPAQNPCCSCKLTRVSRVEGELLEAGRSAFSSINEQEEAPRGQNTAFHRAAGDCCSLGGRGNTSFHGASAAGLLETTAAWEGRDAG